MPDPTGQEVEGLAEVQTFGTFTLALLALADWLAAAGVTHVAMERTGAYWKPVYNLLKGTYTVLLGHAAQVKNMPGRKTDKADARWLAKLLRYGLPQARFIPPAGQRDLRDLTRYRTKLVQERSREVHRVHGVLERANMKLASVASDSIGVSGRAMLDALLAGRADPATMAELACGRMRSKIPALAQALTDVVRDHHRLGLATQLAHIDFLDEHIEALRRALVERRHALAPPAPSVGSPHLTGATSPANPATPPEPVTFARAVALLDTIPGVDQRGAELLVAALRIDMARFGTASRLAAWSGVAPGNDESAGV
jgi:transposase